MSKQLTEQQDIITQAQEMLKLNQSLSEAQKKDVLALLKNDTTAKIKIAEAIMEGRNLAINSRDHTAWLEKLLMFSKHVYGDAPIKNINLELKADITEAIKEAYKKRQVVVDAEAEVIKE